MSSLEQQEDTLRTRTQARVAWENWSTLLDLGHGP